MVIWTALATILGSATPAAACGGFFCNGLQPTEQSGETIVFSVDDSQITAHITISYTGEASEFAWVLPVPGVPELFLSTNTLFSTLQGPSEPEVDMEYTWVDCAPDQITYPTVPDYSYGYYSSSVADTGGAPPAVTVVSQAPVGPYDTVVLQSSDAAAIIEWLQDNGFAVPGSMESVLSPYLAPDTSFLALKLRKDKDTGDLAPLGLRYPGTNPMIPIQLTSVAAVPDMPLTVYLLGDDRGVPLSYLHVQLNPLAMDWFYSGVGPYSERVAAAADEAGGHAFVTLYADEPALQNAMWWEGRYDTVGLDQIADPLQWFQSLAYRGFTGDAELLMLLRDYVPAPEGVDETYFYNWPEYFEAYWATLPFDPVAATAALDERIVTPRREAQQMLDANPYLTRLQSALSADEMTLDPTFGFNPELPAVPSRWVATLETDCDDGLAIHGERTLSLPGGYEVPVPTAAQLEALDLTLEQWLQAQMLHVGLVVEQLSESGQPVVLVDNSAELAWTLDGNGGTLLPGEDPTDTELPPGVTADDGGGADTSAGCGCAYANPMASCWWVLALGAPLFRRRRRDLTD